MTFLIYCIIIYSVIDMKINYNTEKINQLLCDFYNATGLDMDVLKPDFSSVSNYKLKNLSYCEAVLGTEVGEKFCKLSDDKLLRECSISKKTEMRVCHAGLINIVIPLLFNDVIIGYIIFGRIRLNDDFSRLTSYIENLGLDFDLMRGYYLSIPLVNSDKIKSLANIATILAKYLLLENMLSPSFDESIDKAIRYIGDNLTDNISILSIAKNANISKSVLYRAFRKSFNQTVGEYINTKRLEYSVSLLRQTDLSIEEISQRSGFSSSAYYSKVFKKHFGLSPLKFKKSLNT